MTVESGTASTGQSWLQVDVGRTAREVGRWLVVRARRRLPGAAQAVGVCAVAAGVFVLAGLGVGLVVAGTLAVGLGLLFEAPQKKGTG
jgi:hypothetical protein